MLATIVLSFVVFEVTLRGDWRYNLIYAVAVWTMIATPIIWIFYPRLLRKAKSLDYFGEE